MKWRWDEITLDEGVSIEHVSPFSLVWTFPFSPRKIGIATTRTRWLGIKCEKIWKQALCRRKGCTNVFCRDEPGEVQVNWWCAHGTGSVSWFQACVQRSALVLTSLGFVLLTPSEMKMRWDYIRWRGIHWTCFTFSLVWTFPFSPRKIGIATTRTRWLGIKCEKIGKQVICRRKGCTNVFVEMSQGKYKLIGDVPMALGVFLGFGCVSKEAH